MAIKLALTDIDGTILPYGESVINERVIGAMRACVAAGIHVGPASGRAMSTITKSFVGNEDLCRTALTTNGMEVWVEGERIYVAYIDVPLIAKIADFCDEHPDCGMLYFTGPEVQLARGTREGLIESFRAYGERAIVSAPLPSEPMTKVNIYTPNDMDLTRERFEQVCEYVPELDFNIPCPGFLNVTPKGWNKGTAIDLMCEHFGISLDEVAVFGDAGNDIEMLEYVPWSCAVAGATPEAKAAARYVIGPVEEFAVAEMMEAFARGENPLEQLKPER